MTNEIKVQIFVGILTAVASIFAAIVGATWTAEGVASEKVQEIAPRVKLFDLITTDKKKTQFLGDYQVCTLISSGGPHAKQACSCHIESVSTESEQWQLRVNLDESVGGKCNCRAACFNGLVAE